jgi:hypothetical protein
VVEENQEQKENFSGSRNPKTPLSIARRANHFRFSEFVSSPKIKNISLYPNSKQRYIACILFRPEGRRPSSRTWDGDAVDAEAATDERG